MSTEDPMPPKNNSSVDNRIGNSLYFVFNYKKGK